MSMGWMMQVAAMPDMPPFTKGFTAFHAAGGWDLSDIFGTCEATGLAIVALLLAAGLCGKPGQEAQFEALAGDARALRPVRQC